MEVNKPRDLEKIFLEIVTERDLVFHPEKEDNLKRANSGINEYFMWAHYLGKEDPSVNFSSDNISQYLAIIYNQSNQNMVFHLENNLLTTNYLYPSGKESPHEDLISLQKFSKNKKLLFFKLCRLELGDPKKKGFMDSQGIAIPNYKFDYNETKELIKLFLDYTKIKSNQPLQHN